MGPDGHQQVAELFSGKSACDVDGERPICVRIARQLHDLLRRGWRPRRDAGAFVEWDPREFNTTADHAANHALDAEDDWGDNDRQEPEKNVRADSNLRLCVDGALRGGRHAAAGLALYTYRPGEERQLAYRAGRRLQCVHSAFVAELISLELGLNFVANLCTQDGGLY